MTRWPRELRGSLGFDLRYRDLDFGRAIGPEAARVREPLDSRTAELAPMAQRDHGPRFDEVTGLDTLDCDDRDRRRSRLTS